MHLYLHLLIVFGIFDSQKEKSMKKLYRFEWYVGRMGTVRGIFAEEESVINKNIGKPVYFGEILGKHSEIFGNLEEKDLKVLTDDQDFIIKAEQYELIPHGYNPLDYLSEHEEDYDDDESGVMAD